MTQISCFVFWRIVQEKFDVFALKLMNIFHFVIKVILMSKVIV